MKEENYVVFHENMVVWGTYCSMGLHIGNLMDVAPGSRQGGRDVAPASRPGADPGALRPRS